MDDNFKLSDKATIVTGGGSGIGRATALLFAEYGARVAIADINLDGAEETAEMVRQAGGEAFAQRVDVTSSEDVRLFVGSTIDRFGGLDCAANLAGVSVEKGGVSMATSETWGSALEINLTGVFNCMKHQTAVMRDRGGAIVNCSSIGGLIGSSVQPGYVAAKHGVIGLTKSAALEFGRFNIRVNAICPGVIRTAMTEQAFGDQIEEIARQASPLGRIGSAREAASAAVWLCCDASSFVSGTTLVVDGGSLAGVAL